MRLSLSVFGSAFIAARATPYENPYTVAPPLRTDPSGPTCSVEVFDAALSSYGDVERIDYSPSSCPGPWDQIILRLHGSVSGVQFDRWGAVWLNGVELLRLTTPEPDAEGISWTVEKDVSEYADVFTRTGEAALQIPNVVNSEYTGVLNVKVTFEFYKGTGTALGSGRHVMPLVNFAAASSPIPNAMCIKGSESTSASFTLPKKNIKDMWMDVMASGHQCEEFWYTNLPDDNPQMQCGGGAYREFRIFIDGTLAGIAFPFPVLYTGGVNPLLWHPLTGIESFDVEAYRFDISHFLPILNDGQSHEFSLDVVGNSQKGYWCLDPILIMEEDPDVDAFTLVSLTTSFNAEPTLIVTEFPDSGGISQVMTSGSHEFKAGSSMKGDNGRVVEYGISIKLDASNQNRLVGNGEYTNGVMNQNVSVTKGGKGVIMTSKFPYSVYDNSAEDATTFQLDSTVSFAREVTMELTVAGQKHFSASWSNRIDAGAVYNRSNSDHSDINIHTNSGTELFKIFNSETGLCYDRHVAAVDGYTITDSGPLDTCEWPQGMSFCGEKICGLSSSFAGGDVVHTGAAAVPAVNTQVMAARPPVLGATQGGEGNVETLLVRRPADWGKTRVGQPRAVVV